MKRCLAVIIFATLAGVIALGLYSVLSDSTEGFFLFGADDDATSTMDDREDSVGVATDALIDSRPPKLEVTLDDAIRAIEEAAPDKSDDSENQPPTAVELTRKNLLSGVRRMRGFDRVRYLEYLIEGKKARELNEVASAYLSGEFGSLLVVKALQGLVGKRLVELSDTEMIEMGLGTQRHDVMLACFELIREKRKYDLGEQLREYASLDSEIAPKAVAAIKFVKQDTRVKHFKAVALDSKFDETVRIRALMLMAGIRDEASRNALAELSSCDNERVAGAATAALKNIR